MNASDVTHAESSKYMDCIRRCMIRITQYLSDNLPLREDLLQSIEWLNPTTLTKDTDIDEILFVACRSATCIHTYIIGIV